jgi:multidrug efflux pump subunit AcrB
VKGFNASAWALSHRSLVGFLMALMALAGVLSYQSLGRDEDPPFTMKVMIVRALWPGANAVDMARQVTDRIEKQLQSLQYLDYTSGFTKAGEATVMVVLKDSTPPDAVADQWYQVRKKTDDIRYTLPEGVRGPFFNDDFGDVYGVIYALTSDGFSNRELRDYAEFVRSELLLVPDVGKVDLIGVQNEVVDLEFSTRQMAGLGISTDMVASTLRSQNAVVASGTMDTPEERIAVRVSGPFDAASDLQQASINMNGRLLRLSDIAKIKRGYEDPPAPSFRFNGTPAIGIGISMARGGDVLALGRNIHAAMARVRADLPVGIEPHLVSDQPEVVKESVNEFTHSLGEAILIVLVVSFISLGLRAGVVIAVCIPLVLAVTFVVMDMLKIDLQRISLGALVIALGLLVDDAMIAVEMMVKKLEEGWDKFRAATFAYTATAFPMLTGTVVTILGFLPVGFAQSSAGEYCFTMFAVVTIALVVSWVVAVIFTPFVGYAVLKGRPGGPATASSDAGTASVAAPDSPHHEPEGKLTRWFRGVLLATMQRRRMVLVGTAGAFVLSVVLFSFVQQQFFPGSDRVELLVDMKLPQNASIYATTREVERFEKLLSAEKDIEHYSFYVGQGAVRFYLPLTVQLANSNFAQAVIVTKSPEARDALKKKLEAVLDEQFPSLQGRVQALQLGPPVDWPLQYRVMGKDIATVRGISEKVAATLRANASTRIVGFDWNEMSKSVQVDIDQDKARLLGISSERIASSLNSVLSGRTITQMRDDIYLIDVRGRAEARDRGDLQSLRDLQLQAGNGQSVPLAQIATFHYGLEESIIWRRSRLPTITVQAEVVPGVQAATVTKELAAPIAKLADALPPGYRIEVGGAVGESSKGQKSILAVIPVMFIGMLVVLMLQLQSVQKLTIVMLTAPLGLVGVVLALLASGKPFGFVAMLGTFALTGMIIRNSVVLIAQIEDNEAAGVPRWNAVIDATVHRMRPILLTAAAAILGLIPIAGSAFWGPMSFAMMGGLLIATVLTLIFLPALYAVWYRIAPPAA